MIIIIGLQDPQHARVPQAGVHQGDWTDPLGPGPGNSVSASVIRDVGKTLPSYS